MNLRPTIIPNRSIATSLWAGTDDAGVWRFDSGSWQHRSQGLGAGPVSSLALDPFDEDVLLAVVGSQVYRTDDSALTWTPVGMPYTQTGWNKIFWDRVSPGEVVISGPDLGEVFDTDPRAAISRDSGLTWTGIDLPVKDVAKANPGDVWGLDGTWYISGDDYNNIVLGWDCHRKVIWKSTDHGKT